MQIHTFLADSVADAVSQIRETLGPEAVVLNVRRLPAEGLARLWQKPRIEVLAHVPEKSASSIPTVTAAPVLDEVQLSALAELRAEMREMRDSIQKPANPFIVPPSPVAAKTPAPELTEYIESQPATQEVTRPPSQNQGDWRIGSLLEQTGLSPVHAERLVADLCGAHGEAAPISFSDEIECAKQALTTRWKVASGKVSGPHVFVGTPGSGKTTALCKWLAQIALVEGRQAAVWRLDGHIANTAESLSVFAEILGVPVERCAPTNNEAPEADVWFVDLPGVNPNDPAAFAQLQQRIASIPGAQVHLVLNAAYETPLLLAQARAFAALPIQDVIVTHLDEETRWGKLWNLTLGTNCTLRFLAAGQNIPGEFIPATPEEIFNRQFPRKQRAIAAQP
jgi:flagellar biosynthesis protein FlhF